MHKETENKIPFASKSAEAFAKDNSISEEVLKGMEGTGHNNRITIGDLRKLSEEGEKVFAELMHSKLFFSKTYIIMGRPNGEIKSILYGFSFTAAYFGVLKTIVKYPIREAIFKSLKYDFGTVFCYIIANNVDNDVEKILGLFVSLLCRFLAGTTYDDFIEYYIKRGYKIVDSVKASSNTEAERVYFNKIGQTRPKSKSNESFDKSGVKKDDPYLEIERIHSLLEKGIITKEEFELKKKQLLNL